MLLNTIYPDGRHPFSVIYKGRINLYAIAGGIMQASIVLKHSTERDRFISLTPFDATPHTWQNEIEECDKFGVDINNIFYLCNYAKQFEECKSYGLNCSYIVETNYVDWHFWKPTNVSKLYDGLVSCRPNNHKRPFLTSKVKNLAVVVGGITSMEKVHGEVDMRDIPHAFINERFLSAKEMKKIHNLSRTYICTSLTEGACRSSSQSLLCGVPVISMSDATGGREVYYNEYNSIICKPTQEAVKDAVEQALEKKWDREKIRSNYLDQAMGFRKATYQLIEEILSEGDIKEDGEKLFTKAYRGEQGFSYFGSTYPGEKEIKNLMANNV